MINNGFPKHLAEAVAQSFHDIREGKDAPTFDTVERVTGRKPVTFRQRVENNRNKSPEPVCFNESSCTPLTARCGQHRAVEPTERDDDEFHEPFSPLAIADEKLTNEMVRRLIHLREQENRGVSL